MLLAVLHGVHLLLRNLDVHLVAAHLEKIMEDIRGFLIGGNEAYCWMLEEEEKKKRGSSSSSR